MKKRTGKLVLSRETVHLLKLKEEGLGKIAAAGTEDLKCKISQLPPVTCAAY